MLEEARLKLRLTGKFLYGEFGGWQEELWGEPAPTEPRGAVLCWELCCASTGALVLFCVISENANEFFRLVLVSSGEEKLVLEKSVRRCCRSQVCPNESQRELRWT